MHAYFCLQTSQESTSVKRFVTLCMRIVRMSLLFLIFLLNLITSSAEQELLDHSSFSNVLKQLQDNVLGVKKLQRHFDNLKFVHDDIDGYKLIENLANVLKQRMHEKIFALTQIKTAVENAYSNGLLSSSETYPECCKVEPTVNDYRFKTKVFSDKFCENRAKPLSPKAKHLPKSVLDAMVKNANGNPDLRWQYFGSQEGIFSVYPAFKYPDCFNYDHRIRTWYVQGIAPEPKDIVLIIDKSGSMDSKHGEKTLMEIAVTAATTVLDSLNPKDRVGIVTFADSAETPPGNDETSRCYATKLTTAVPVNIKFLKQFLKGVPTGGRTFYGGALKKAFDLLKSDVAKSASKKRKKVLLFLTDGKPTDGESSILQVLEREKQSLKSATSKDAVLFAYGIGEHDFSLLKRIAEDTEAEGTKGRFTAISIEHLDQLRHVFSSFYDFFAKTTVQPSHYISVPYYDALGLGQMVTIFVPCFNQQKVIGVAGTDIVFSDLISDVFFFSKGQYSYAFLIDRGTGDTVIHPFMPTLQAAHDDPVILHTTALEQSAEFKHSVLQSMIRGDKGHSTFFSKRYFPLGSVLDSGVRELNVNSTYYWRPVEGTNLSVCIVLGENGKETRLETVSKVSNLGSFVYHREIDLKQEKEFEECSHYGRRGTIDRAVVKFSAQCFKKPYDYATLQETEATVDAFEEYIKTGTSNPEPKFKPGVRGLTLAGMEAEQIWNEETSGYKDYTSYLTYATTNGIISIKPGTVIDKTYDPTQRLWFQNAVNNKGKLTLSTPYLDAFGSGFLIDVMHALYEGKSGGTHSANDEVVAVLDASFGMFQFYRLLTELYPKCQHDYRCFIMDKSGLLVIHKHFVEFDTVSDLVGLSKRIEDIHITELEKAVAEDLIKKNVLQRKQCKIYKEIQKENFYEVHLNGTLQSTSECPRYQITKLKGTNTYLGVVDILRCPNSGGRCFCPVSLYSTTTKECVCPFKSKLEYDYCDNDFPSTSAPLCPVPPPILTSFDAPEVELHKNLKNCFEENCGSTNIDEVCFRQESCSWCVYSKDKSVLLKNPFCTSSEKCYGGVEGNSLSTLYPTADKKEKNNNEADKESSNLTSVIAGSVAAIIILIIVLSLVAYKKYCRGESTGANVQHGVYVA